MKRKREGDCYRVAFECLHDGNHGLGSRAVLVHGYPTGTGGEAAGKKFGHAWIESGTGALVFDAVK